LVPVSIKNFSDIAALAADEMHEIVLFPELLMKRMYFFYGLAKLWLKQHFMWPS
jgi:hypothetical protein